MKVAVVSSGSKANCSYIDSGNGAILIDCGLSAKQCLARLAEIDVDIKGIKAILITHEHGDHIRGISVLSRQLRVPVYANKLTARKLPACYAIENFESGEGFSLAGFEIHPFSIVHDAVDPVGFSLYAGGHKYSQATDLGRVTKLVRESVKDSNFLLLESNYDQQMLHECSYPWELKQRISSAHGHLSNEDAAMFLHDLRAGSALRHVVLGHLSENSNSPELALSTAAKFNDLERFQNLVCASVYKTTPLISL